MTEMHKIRLVRHLKTAEHAYATQYKKHSSDQETYAMLLDVRAVMEWLKNAPVTKY